MKEHDKKTLETLTKMLGSEGKIKVLWTLYKNQKTAQTAYMILKQTGLKRSGLNKILKNFIETGIIKKEDYTVKKYRLNIEDEKVKELIEFFKKIENIL
ncbi:MAG: hypothetical protein H5T50_05770 [Nitrososphaeria archaeon]|nr:hypothetical protein [Nitrososphaeria archaeon]